MTRPLIYVGALVLVASAMMLVMTGSRAANARAAARDSRRELTTVSRQATELIRLRHGTRNFPVKPEAGLSARVAAAMASAGLAGSVFQNLSPEAQSAITGVAGTKLIRQRATLTLADLSLPQVGKFLDAWRTTEPDWVVSGIDLSPISSGSAPATLGTDLPLRAVITVEGVFTNATPGGSR